MLQFFVLILATLVVLLILKFLAPFNRRVRKAYFTLYFIVFWNAPLRYLLENYLPATDELIKEFREGYTKGTVLKWIYTSYSGLSLLIYLLVPIPLFFYFRKNVHRFRR